MDATLPGFCLLPTLGHVHDRLPRFLKAAIATHVSVPGLIIVDRADFEANQNSYDSLTLPDRWSIVVHDGESNTGAKSEWAWREYCQDAAWVIWLSDDLQPETPQWDVKTLAHLTGYNVVSTADGVFAPNKMNGAIAFSGDLVRAVGHIFAPGLKHFFVDDTWERLGQQTGCWSVDMSIMVRHEHDLVTGRLDNMNDHKNSFWNNDQQVFTDWRKHAEHEAAERILALMESKGLAILRPDLNGVSLMLAVPSMTRQYDGKFMDSRVATEKHVTHFGGEFALKELPFCSDPALARIKLFGEFLRSDHTHMLFVDDDMGWNPADVVKMISYGKDFVAAAGPRKTFPPSFAVSCTDDQGNPGQIVADPVTGLLRAGDGSHMEIGMAFCLVTKAWAVRMSQMYADLTFRTADGRDEIGVFLPMIVNNRYRSEDFSACYRWNSIGGMVYVDASVKLDHVGISVYSGSWGEHLQKMMARQEAA